jgi:prepilin-type N-terminal cleavage/methylation domain-containing protein
MTRRTQNSLTTWRTARERAGGFTLMEILIAMAVAGLILVSLNTFIFSMGELWGKNTDLRLFDQHVRAVTRFLDRQFRAATLPPASTSGATPIAPQEIRPASGSTDNMLTFELPAGCRLIHWPDRPLPEVVCALQVRPNDGLYLLWHSRLETKFDSDPPHETLVTPLVSAMSYDYYDSQFRNWKNETVLRRDSNNQPQVPQRIRLKFTYGKLTKETSIAVPIPPQALPNF